MQNYPLPAAVANAQGIATTTLPSQAVGTRWKVQFITVQSDSLIQSKAQVLLNNQPVIATSKGNLDTASGDPPIPVTGKDKFQIQWTSCTPGATCTAVIWYE